MHYLPNIVTIIVYVDTLELVYKLVVIELL